MALPNSIPLFTIPKVFFTPYFDNAIATIVKNLYLYFGNAIAANFFFFLIATIANFFFFFLSFGFPCTHSHFEHPLRQQVWAEEIAAIPLPKIKNFSLLLFISLFNFC